MKKALWFLVIAVPAILWALHRRKSPAKYIRSEFQALDNAAAAKKHAIKTDAETAKAQIRAQHAETIRKLDEKKKAKADELSKMDPSKFAAYLTRVARESE